MSSERYTPSMISESRFVTYQAKKASEPINTEPRRAAFCPVAEKPPFNPASHGFIVVIILTLSSRHPISLANVSAAATAIVSTAGTISAIHITNAGLGYTVAPTITIASPSGSGSGTFAFNEIVTGSTSGTTGRVRTWNSTTNVLELGSVDGTFIPTENIVGSTSGASFVLRVVDVQPLDDGFADNINIETEADSILDFSEQNPFGIP